MKAAFLGSLLAEAHKLRELLLVVVGEQPGAQRRNTAEAAARVREMGAAAEAADQVKPATAVTASNLPTDGRPRGWKDIGLRICACLALALILQTVFAEWSLVLTQGVPTSYIEAGNNTACLLAFCEANPQAMMCASSGCLDTEQITETVAQDNRAGLSQRPGTVVIGGRCWEDDASDPCADSWRGVACGCEPPTACAGDQWNSTVTGLYLSGNQLEELPTELWKCANVQNMDLSNNRLTELRQEIVQLVNLDNLDLTDNLLVTLPPEINQLNGMSSQTLHINGNPIPKRTSFPMLFDNSCPTFDPPFAPRDGMCVRCDETEGEYYAQFSFYAVVFGASFGLCALYHFTRNNKDQEIARDAVENREAAKGAQSNDAESAKLVGKNLSTLAKIVTAQLQQSFTFISWNWGWPELLASMRLWLGNFVLPDVPSITNVDCMVDGSEQALYMRGFEAPAVLLSLLGCIGCCSWFLQHKAETSGDAVIEENAKMLLIRTAVVQSSASVASDQVGELQKWSSVRVLGESEVDGHMRVRVGDDEWITRVDANGNHLATTHLDLVARSAHWSNFGWALFTMASPAVVAGIALIPHFGLAVTIASPFWLFIPIYASQKLRRAKAMGFLRSRAFEERYAWLCARYLAEGICPYWELIVLESRFATIFIGSFMHDSLLAAIFIIVVTLGLFITHIKLKPFLETIDEATHWSSANQMGVLGYVCTLVILMIGLVSILGDPLDETVALVLALLALLVIMLPLALTVVIIMGVHDGDLAHGEENDVLGEDSVAEEVSSATAEEVTMVDNPVEAMTKLA